MQNGEQIIFPIDSFGFDGAGVGRAHGKIVRVFGALPGEMVEVEIIGRKKGERIGRLLRVTKLSPYRQAPQEDHYLSCSAWQVIRYDQELFWKKKMAQDLFASVGIELPELTIVTDDVTVGYRNKMEFTLAEVEGKISSAFHARHTRKLLPLSGCVLAQKEINDALEHIVSFLNAHEVPPSAVKSLILRANRAGKILAGLFAQDRAVALPPIKELLSGAIKGISVFYSPPEAPASRPEGLLASVGEEKIYEEILGKRFPMTILSYFQINPPVFEMALSRMREFINEGDDVLDFFSGVGAIGLSLADKIKTLTAVELDDASFTLLQEGIGSAHAVHVSDRKARELIDSKHVLIMDPPRAGTHPKVIRRILEVLPPKIIYLSCNPVTQAHDLSLLKEKYQIKHAELFNFFPRTPHIESFFVLERV
ncbi:MAG: hypothetical protein AAB367_01825 [Patescibacteria group bacterium]|mgnify:CR=1 FL=1